MDELKEEKTKKPNIPIELLQKIDIEVKKRNINPSQLTKEKIKFILLSLK
jgi:hypothetical protein